MPKSKHSLRYWEIAILVLIWLAGPSKVDKAEAATGWARVERNLVPVYSQMDTTSGVVKWLMRGDLVTVDPVDTVVEGDWCRVKEIGRAGWGEFSSREEAKRTAQRLTVDGFPSNLVEIGAPGAGW